MISGYPIDAKTRRQRCAIDTVAGGRGNDACLATADGLGGDSLGPGFDTEEGDSADDVRGLENEQVCFAD